MADLEFSDDEGSDVTVEQPSHAVVTFNGKTVMERKREDETAEQFADRLKRHESHGAEVRPATQKEIEANDSVKEQTENALPDAIKVKRDGKTYLLHRAGIEDDTWKGMVDRAPKGSELIYDAKPAPPPPAPAQATEDDASTGQPEPAQKKQEIQGTPQRSGSGALPLSASADEEPVQASADGGGGGGGFFGAIRDAAGKMALGASNPANGNPVPDENTPVRVDPISEPERPADVPRDAVYDPASGAWRRDTVAPTGAAGDVLGAAGKLAGTAALASYPPTSYMPTQQTYEDQARARVAGMPTVPGQASAVDAFPSPQIPPSVAGAAPYQPQFGALPSTPKLSTPDGRGEIAAVQQQADVAAQESAQKSLIQARAMDRDQALIQQQAALAREQQSAMEQHITRVQRIQVEMRKVQNVDPNRLWNHMSTGQHIGAAIGMALAGIGAGAMAAVGVGNGDNPALKIIDDAINRDIDSQKFNIQQRRDALKEDLSAELTIGSLTRQKFTDSIQASSVQRQMMWENVKHQLDNTATMFEGPKAQAQADMLKAQIDSKIAAETDRQALQVHAMAVQNYQLGLQREHLKMQAAAAQNKVARAEPLDALTRNLLAEQQAALAELKDIRSKYIEAQSGVTGVLGRVPGVDQLLNRFVANRIGYQSAANMNMGPAHQAIEGGVLRQGSVKRWEGYYPELGKWNTMGELEKLDALEQATIRKYNRELEAARSGGKNIGSFKPASGEEGEE